MPGDRQIVRLGEGDGRGFVFVVDFNGAVRPRQDETGRIMKGLYEGWARISDLAKPVTDKRWPEHPALRRLKGARIKNIWSLTPEEAQAICDLAGGLPPMAEFEEGEVDWDEPGGEWGRNILPPESITEEIVADNARIARKLGFRSRVSSQKGLSTGYRPDLWCVDGVMGEVKNQVTAAWGPDQIEGYIEQCDREWPEYEWQGVLVQGVPDMAPNALPRLRKSRYRDRLTVWSVLEGEKLRRVKATRLFP